MTSKPIVPEQYNFELNSYTIKENNDNSIVIIPVPQKARNPERAIENPTKTVEELKKQVLQQKNPAIPSDVFKKNVSVLKAFLLSYTAHLQASLSVKTAALFSAVHAKKEDSLNTPLQELATLNETLEKLAKQREKENQPIVAKAIEEIQKAKGHPDAPILIAQALVKVHEAHLMNSDFEKLRQKVFRHFEKLLAKPNAALEPLLPLVCALDDTATRFIPTILQNSQLKDRFLHLCTTWHEKNQHAPHGHAFTRIERLLHHLKMQQAADKPNELEILEHILFARPQADRKKEPVIKAAQARYFSLLQKQLEVTPKNISEKALLAHRINVALQLDQSATIHAFSDAEESELVKISQAKFTNAMNAFIDVANAQGPLTCDRAFAKRMYTTYADLAKQIGNQNPYLLIPTLQREMKGDFQKVAAAVHEGYLEGNNWDNLHTLLPKPLTPHMAEHIMATLNEKYMSNRTHLLEVLCIFNPDNKKQQQLLLDIIQVMPLSELQHPDPQGLLFYALQHANQEARDALTTRLTQENTPIVQAFQEGVAANSDWKKLNTLVTDTLSAAMAQKIISTLEATILIRPDKEKVLASFFKQERLVCELIKKLSPKELHSPDYFGKTLLYYALRLAPVDVALRLIEKLKLDHALRESVRNAVITYEDEAKKERVESLAKALQQRSDLNLEEVD